MPNLNGDQRSTIVAAISRAMQRESWKLAENPEFADRLADIAYGVAVGQGMVVVPPEVTDGLQEAYDAVVAERDRLREMIFECGLCSLRETEWRRDERKAQEQTATGETR